MILKNELFKILYSPHISEKSSGISEKYNKITFKVNIHATKNSIKLAIKKIFLVDVSKVNIVFMKGKRKMKGKYNTFRNNWKKAYVTLKAGQKIDLINDA